MSDAGNDDDDNDFDRWAHQAMRNFAVECQCVPFEPNDKETEPERDGAGEGERSNRIDVMS